MSKEAKIDFHLRKAEELLDEIGDDFLAEIVSLTRDTFAVKIKKRDEGTMSSISSVNPQKKNISNIQQPRPEIQKQQ